MYIDVDVNIDGYVYAGIDVHLNVFACVMCVPERLLHLDRS